MCTEFKSNAIRGPLNAWMFNVLTRYTNHLFGQSKKLLFSDHPEMVVEIGPGTGANMPYYRKGTRLVAIEPNPHMHASLKKSADAHGILLEIKSLRGEVIDLPDNCCDFVVSTLVLCTVDDPTAVINQIKRILKPGGKFAFIEHVKAREKSVLSVIQTLMRKPWFWFFEGCDVRRSTKRLIENSGFSSVEIEEYRLKSIFTPINQQIRGRAVA